jgi:hypothetical protein
MNQNCFNFLDLHAHLWILETLAKDEQTCIGRDVFSDWSGMHCATKLIFYYPTPLRTKYDSLMFFSELSKVFEFCVTYSRVITVFNDRKNGRDCTKNLRTFK